jgi:hypothetical protein
MLGLQMAEAQEPYRSFIEEGKQCYVNDEVVFTYDDFFKERITSNIKGFGSSTRYITTHPERLPWVLFFPIRIQ